MLLRDITKVKEFIPVNNTLEFQKLIPFVADAEKIISESISQTFYNELDAYITSLIPVGEPPVAPGTPDAFKDAIILKLQDAISFLCFYLGFDILNTVFSNYGFHRVETEDGSKKALYQRQEENLKRTFIRQGYNKLDIALEYLEANKTHFPTWVASEAYTLTKSYLINSTKEFSNIYNINNSRLMFIKLRNYQVLAEDFDIKTLIGLDYYESLKAQILSGTITEADEMFLLLLKKAVAYCTIYRGGISLIAELNEYGLYQTQFDVNEQNLKAETPVSKEIALSILAQAEQNAKSYKKSCESFLKKNITDYPLYANSTAYSVTGSIYDLEGTDKIGII